MARTPNRMLMVILALFALIAGGISFIMFSDVAPQQVRVEKALDNARFIQ